MSRLKLLGLIAILQLGGVLAVYGQAIGPNGLPIGPLRPPIDPQDVFRSQPQPMTRAPSAPVIPPAGPQERLHTPVAPALPLSSAPVGRIESRHHRVARCRHKAAHVSRRHRARYFRRCTRASD